MLPSGDCRLGILHVDSYEFPICCLDPGPGGGSQRGYACFSGLLLHFRIDNTLATAATAINP